MTRTCSTRPRHRGKRRHCWALHKIFLQASIEVQKSDWIKSFNGKSLTNLDEKGWRVKKDGGQFDAFTGATITPRAVVDAVHKALLYFEQHKSELLYGNSSQPELAEAN